MSLAFSANLGFLFTEYALLDAVRAASRAGFQAVELHWPYATAPADLRQALDETGLPVLGLNTVRGDLDKGDFGLAALPGRETDARAAIDEAIAYAQAIAAQNVHVMAGCTKGADAERTFADNLAYACKAANARGIGILIEPLNTRDVPGYFLTDIAHAARIIDRVGAANLRIMADCYHMQIMGGDLLTRLMLHLPKIGHIQFAAVPDRTEPDHGEIDFPWLLKALGDAGYDRPFGAEYKPRGRTEDGLGWMTEFGAPTAGVL